MLEALVPVLTVLPIRSREPSKAAVDDGLQGLQEFVKKHAERDLNMPLLSHVLVALLQVIDGSNAGASSVAAPQA